MTKVINKEYCPTCGRALNKRGVELFKGMVAALYQVWRWCIENNRSEKIKMNEIRHLFGQVVYSNFAYLRDFAPDMVSGEKGKHYDFNLKNIAEFFAGKRTIFSKLLIVSGKKEEMEKCAPVYANQVPEIAEVLTKDREFIVTYHDKMVLETTGQQAIPL